MDYPNRKRIRLKDYDYSGCNAYSVTICTKNGVSLWVGEDGDEPVLSDYGLLTVEGIRQIHEKYPNVTVDRYRVMSNHVHILISIISPDGIRSADSKSISVIIGQMKRWVSRQAGKPLWQKSFYDRIIRNKEQYLNTWNYIEYNHKK